MTSRLKGEASLYLVVNAATKESDFAYIAERLKGVATLAPRPDRALLALQGPAGGGGAGAPCRRASTRSPSCRRARAEVAGVPAIVSRTGYTGEDGFEISVAGRRCRSAWRARLLAEPEVLPIGLGARDSLRLEAGLCLYGHDIDETTDPVEADLVWSIGKRRKHGKGFSGRREDHGRVLNGTASKRVGILPEGRAPARDGTRDRRQDRPRHRPHHLAAASGPA